MTFFMSLFNLLFSAGNNCAEYSQGGKRIQRNGIVPCKNCPSYYFSNETFKCKFYMFMKN